MQDLYTVRYGTEPVSICLEIIIAGLLCGSVSLQVADMHPDPAFKTNADPRGSGFATLNY
jgi:hypothetical protein